MTMKARTGGQLLIDALGVNGVDTIFGVPGESYLYALDAIHERAGSIRFITCRQEGGAAYMADAYASATGKPGVCFVTRGPGATNAAVGLHTAYQDSIPMILLIGQIPRASLEREAFQEIDYRRMLAPVTKWVAQVDQAERLGEFVNRAIRVATSGRPGPVALALPEDMLKEQIWIADLPPAVTSLTYPDPGSIKKLGAMLSAAKQPLLVLGGSSWSTKGREAIHQFAAKHQLPVATGFRRQSLFDNDHPCYAGSLIAASFPPLKEYAASADLIVAVGSRLADMTSARYTTIAAPRPEQKLVQVLPSAEELGRVLMPDVAICADMGPFCTAALKLDSTSTPARQQATINLVQSHRSSMHIGTQPGPVDMAHVMEVLRQALPRDAIVTNGAGNFADWPNKFYSYRAERTILGPVSGSMGYGVPAAVAAKIAFPGRIVVGFSGDGDFLMNGQELATAVQYGANPIILVINNSSYGTIRMHQEKNFPGRVSGTGLVNPDFAAYARAFGAIGEVVERTDQFAGAFDRALAADRATLLELRVGSDSLGPDLQLSTFAS